MRRVVLVSRFPRGFAHPGLPLVDFFAPPVTSFYSGRSMPPASRFTSPVVSFYLGPQAPDGSLCAVSHFPRVSVSVCQDSSSISQVRFSCTPVLRTARAPLDDRSSGRAVRDLVLNKSGAVEERALPLKRGSAVRYLTGSAESADRCRQHVLRGAVKVRGVTDESAESCSGTPPALPDRGVKTTSAFSTDP